MSAAAILYLLGMGLLFLGERLLGADPAARGVFAVLALAGLAASVALRVRMLRASSGSAAGDVASSGRPGDAEGQGPGRILALVMTLAGIGSLAGYAFTLPGMVSFLGLEGEAAGRWVVVLSALWPIVWLCAGLSLLLIDWVQMQMPVVTQPRRVVQAASTGLCLALAISLAFPVNFLASRHSRGFDLRGIRTTAAGEATRAMVEALSEPLEVYLFFPPANDVRREIDPYFEDLGRASELLRVVHADQAAALDLAEKLRVSSNGTVVLARGDETERINLGTDLDGARRNLRKFDELFQRRFLELTRAARKVYFTVGHEEMHWSGIDDETRARRISGAKRVLEQLNFEVAELGVAEGLGRELPGDAAAVVVAGPREQLLPEAVAALEQYAEDGGRILLLLEPGEEEHEHLAGLLGVRFHSDLVLNDRHFLRRSRTNADRSLIVTDRFSSHPSVSTLSRHSSRLALILDGTGWLETEGGEELRVSATVRSMPRSWADVLANYDFDAESEERKTWDLGAAVEREVEGGTFRGAVLANASAISDLYLGNQANVQWFVDTMRWLTDDESLSGLVESEEDVRIQHTRDQDVAWFYGTIFGVPLIVLVGGLFYVQRRRRRSATC